MDGGLSSESGGIGASAPVERGEEPLSSAPPPLSRWKRWLLPTLGVALAALALFTLHNLSKELDYASVTAAITATSWPATLGALAATALSYIAMLGYDMSAVRHLRPVPRVSMGTAALASFCGFALSNSAGVGAFTGGAVRWRIYGAAGLAPPQITRLLVFVTGSFTLGIFLVAALGVLVYAGDFAFWFEMPEAPLRIGAGLLVAAFLGLCVLGRLRAKLKLGRWTFAVPRGRVLAFQALISLVDIGAAAAVLWLLLPEGAGGLPQFMALYAVAIAIGAISHLPGGIGVFEAVVLYAYRGSGVPLDAVAGALVLYRVFYFVLPLVIAIALLTAMEINRRTSFFADGTRAVRASTRLIPRFLGLLAFAAGAALLFGGVTPPSDDIPGMFAPSLPTPIFEASYLVASVGGVALLFVANGLAHRLDGAWWLAMFLGAGGFVLSLARGGGKLEALLLVALCIALLLTHDRFDRRARMLSPSMTASWWLAVAGVAAAATWVMFFAYRDVSYDNELWWRFELDDSAPRAMRVALGAALFVGLAGLWLLLRPAHGRVQPPSEQDIADAMRAIEAKGRAGAKLVAMGDKSLLFDEKRENFIMYGRRGRSWIALFDPVADPRASIELVWRFREMADAQGGRPAFYQVRPDNLPLYIDAGFQPLKLGEAARIPLATFELKGKSRQPLRSALNRAEREGLTFEVVPAGQVGPLMPELSRVSDAWLAEHKAREKAFSLGTFTAAYMDCNPVGIVRGPDKAIIAFASVLEIQEPGKAPRETQVSVDLMRHVPDVPPGTMDFLFLKLIMRAKEQGHAWFDLGMAPLSGLAAHRLAPVWHRLGGLIFRRGEKFYNFRGLRAFKEKFEPVWEARYLCTAGGLDPWVVLADVAALQSGGLRGVIGK
ncbi:bifunctional lysylphosphatidylglycerol flippase/synthetase MprF [Acetobacteraceae bacterium H6797]|nr:bifunctional lysylphosphatidylglycerol flippase/synthetase MprF [Acetobacteraceae bacterium H6797]